MGIPILQIIHPPVTNQGLTVECYGHNLSEGTVIYEPDLGGIVEIPTETTEDRKIKFIVPINLPLGKGELFVRNLEGDSDKLRFSITSDPMLGFGICLQEKTADDLRVQAYKLSPNSLIPFSQNESSGWQRLLGSICEEIARVRGRGCDLRTEMVPQLTTDLLPEWETELGLPEPCNLNAPVDFEERKKEVVRKYKSTGGSTATYFKELAALMGLDVTIEESTESRQFLSGLGRSGDRIWGIIWLFTWFVTVNNYEIGVFRSGQNVSGTPLRWWSAAEIECFFNQLKPAHTNVVIRFTPGGGQGPWGFGYFPFGLNPFGL